MIFPPAVSGAAAGYRIGRSLRFRSSASTYLSRALTSSRTTATFSTWIKRGNIGGTQTLLGWSNGSTNSFNVQLASDALEVFNYSTTFNARKVSSALLRDTTERYHVQVNIDTTNATASDRLRLYVNGQRLTSFTTSIDPSSGLSLNLGNGSTFGIGAQGGSLGQYFDGYQSEIHYVDGQSLDPSNFGETDANGVWIPKQYQGSHGTGGFYLPFSDGTSLTTLGYDQSANSNDWTLNNFSLTAGFTYDWMLDTPTSNYPTLNYVNPLVSGSIQRMADGSLRLVGGSVDYSWGFSTFELPSSGKFYVEALAEVTTTGEWSFGISTNGNTTPVIDIYSASSSTNVRVNGSNVQSTSIANGDVFSLSVDCGTGVVQVRRNNTLVYTSSPLSVSGKCISAYRRDNFGIRVNFGQQPYNYTPPTGYSALTDNALSSTITTSGSFTGNASADGPVVYLNGVPTAMTINGNAVTFGTHADKLANGFKVRSSSASYNAAGSNTYSITSTGAAFKNARAQVNP